MSLTYEDIIDGFQQACNLHYQVNEFSTSPLLSDLEVGTKGNQDPAVFPYVFLQPTGGQLAQGKMVYSFNMIVMDRVKPDMYKETNTISDMIQIGQDLIAWWNWSVPRPDADIMLPIQVLPFVERFDSSLSGATFQLQIETPFILDRCIAPFKFVPPPVPPPVPVDCTNYVDLTESVSDNVNGSYESGGYGYWSYNSGTGAVAMIFGTAPDGNDYKVYYKTTDNNYALAVVFVDGVIDTPPNSYNWIDIVAESWFGSSEYEANGDDFIPKAPGGSLDYTVSYPEC